MIGLIANSAAKGAAVCSKFYSLGVARWKLERQTRAAMIIYFLPELPGKTFVNNEPDNQRLFLEQKSSLIKAQLRSQQSVTEWMATAQFKDKCLQLEEPLRSLELYKHHYILIMPSTQPLLNVPST